MNACLDRRWFRVWLVTDVAMLAGLLVANPVLAQPGSGNCQRSKGGSGNRGPQTAMRPPGYFNNQGPGGGPNPDRYSARPAQEPAPLSRQELQARSQAKLTKIRERKAAVRAANRAANVSRQQPKSTRASTSSSPTA
jgi:hypothetical protein